MAEEKIDNSTPTSDDMDMLRIVLQNVKGISPISTTAYSSADDEDFVSEG